MRKLNLLVAALTAAVLFGCSSSTAGGHGIDGGQDAGPTDGGGTATFQVVDLDLKSCHAGPNDFVAAALAPDGRIGVAFYGDVDLAHKDVDYLEVQTDGTTTCTTLEAGVERISHLGVTFDDQNTAHVAYLGNDPNLVEPIETVGGDGGQFWFQSDLAIAHIAPGGGLTQEYPATNGFAYTHCGNPVSDRDSQVVGVSPSIAMDGSTIVTVHRNLHNGQFPVQDYGKSDWDGTVGTAGNWTSTAAVCGSDNGGAFVTVGVGEDSSIAVSNGTVLALSGGQTDLDGTVRGLYTVQYANGAWTGKQALFTQDNLTPNDGSGPRIAGDDTAGFGITWVDMTSSRVFYAQSADGVTWNGHEDVFGNGTGGWYPNLAFDPILHSPVVAYYLCSLEPGVNTCPPQEDELRVAVRRTNATWAQNTVDAEGGAYPNVLFNGGQMLIVYRASSGGLRLAKQVAQ